MFLYQIILTLIIFFSPLIIIYRIFKNKEDKQRFTEKFSLPSIKKKVNLFGFMGKCWGNSKYNTIN